MTVVPSGADSVSVYELLKLLMTGTSLTSLTSKVNVPLSLSPDESRATTVRVMKG